MKSPDLKTVPNSKQQNDTTATFIQWSSKTYYAKKAAVYIRSLGYEAEPQCLFECVKNADVEKHSSHFVPEISQPRHIKTPREEAEGDDV